MPRTSPARTSKETPASWRSMSRSRTTSRGASSRPAPGPPAAPGPRPGPRPLASPSMAATIWLSPPSPGWKEATSRPSRRTVHMSQCSRTSASRWEMNSTDRLRCFQRPMMAKTRSDRSGGRAAVISSSTSSWGSKTSARARSSMRRKGRGMSRTCSSRSRPSRSISASSRRTSATSTPVSRRFWLDGEVADQRRVLVDRGQALGPGLGRAAQQHRLAVDGDGAAVVAQHAGQDLDQGRLAGAVGPEQGVDLAGGDRQVDRPQGDHRAERLGHGGRLQERLCHQRVRCRATRPGPCRRTAGRWCRWCTASPRRPR